MKYPNFLKVNVNFNDAAYWPWENRSIITNLKKKNHLISRLKHIL